MSNTVSPRIIRTAVRAVERPTVAVLSVVTRDDYVVLVRRANPPDVGFWGFPGGKIELGETIERAAVRELQEETGIAASAVDVFTAVDAIELRSDSIAHHYVLVAVLCRWLSGEPVAADDALEAGWFDRQTLMRAETVKSFAVDAVATKAFALLETRLRSHG